MVNMVITRASSRICKFHTHIMHLHTYSPCLKILVFSRNIIYCLNRLMVFKYYLTVIISSYLQVFQAHLWTQVIQKHPRNKTITSYNTCINISNITPLLHIYHTHTHTRTPGSTYCYSLCCHHIIQLHIQFHIKLCGKQKSPGSSLTLFHFPWILSTY